MTLEIIFILVAFPTIGLLSGFCFDQLRKYFLQLARDIIDLRKHYELTQIELQEKRQELERLERN